MSTAQGGCRSRQPGGDLAPAFGRRAHAQRERLHRPDDIQQECGSSWKPKALRVSRTGRSRSLAAGDAPGDQVGVAADVFGQRVDAHSTPWASGVWKTGPSMVLSQTTSGACPEVSAQASTVGAHERQVDHGVVGFAGVST